ncbi:MAG TPA: glycine oxidase ThiO [Vicinamibacterales bacterium]|nr:glycine oxidase ThiO [Vicinamibacterales bacterium]
MSRPSDFIVVGAGIVGCSVAYELARRGASVEIVDERPVGMGATQASAGVLAPYIEAREGSALLDLTVRSLALYDDFVGRVTEASGQPVLYRRTGTLDVATDERGLQALRATADVLATRSVPALLLDAAATRSEEPLVADDVTGALLIEEHGFVSAPELTRALAAAARVHGAQLLEQSRVRRICSRDGDAVVETDRGTLSSSAVVLAAGSWSSTIAIDGVAAPVPVRPVRGQLLYLGWSGTQPRRVTWSRSCYIVPWDDGTVLVGATSEDAGFDERLTVSGVHDLLQAVADVVPHAWSVTFRGARVGLRPATSDALPVIGRSPSMPTLTYATGHYRNGILLAPLTGQLVADLLLDGRADPMLDAVSPLRFPGL